MNYSIEAQAEALYLFNMNANIKEEDYPVEKDLWSLYINVKGIESKYDSIFKTLVQQYSEFKKKYVEFNDSVILYYLRNILLYKLTTLYQHMLNDNELLENLK